MISDIKVLIVEDHALTAAGLAQAISDAEACTLLGVAETCSRGRDMAAQLNPDVVVLDLHLPDCDNPRLLLKDFCTNKPWKVLVFSGENRPAFIEAVLKHGAAAYLLKSADGAKVIRTIKAIVAGFTPILAADLVDPPELSPAQGHILRLLAQGLRYEQISALRDTSVSTVKKQCIALQIKLAVSSREELIAWAARNGYANIS